MLFSLSASCLPKHLAPDIHVMPPCRNLHAWMNLGGSDVQSKEMDKVETDRAIGELISPGVLETRPAGRSEGPAAVAGVKVWHRSYDPTDRSRGRGGTARDSICREHHLRV